jgi:pimeloyl-ACP methyl ester carboxylesterase
MPYGDSRDSAYLARLQPLINAFALTYSAAKPTIILFPGGMASKLMRANKSFPVPPTGYYTSWLSNNIASGEAKHLPLQANGNDFDDRFVVPDGYIDYVVHPYNNFAGWCTKNGIQLFVCGFDWRRSAKFSADFFRTSVLPALDAAIPGGGGLQNFTLVGHSLGGMVVKLIANETSDPCVHRMTHAITVGSPFYGYGAQIHRYLKGIPTLDWTLADPLHQDRTMIGIIASMPGGYEFLYLDETSFNLYKPDFAKDAPGFVLASYPCMDKDVPTTVADPYHPVDSGNMVRYPLFNPANMTMLTNGLAISTKVSDPLDPGVADKFYCIRGVQKKYGARLNGTVVRSSWKRVNKTTYDPDKNLDPIKDTKGFGDGTQPAWGARLLQLLDPPYSTSVPAHVITVEGDLKHENLMNDHDVQSAIASIMSLSTVVFMALRRPPEIATHAEFSKFLEKMPKDDQEKPKKPGQRRRDLNKYLATFTRHDRHRLYRRAFADLLKSPAEMVDPPSRTKRKHAKPKAKAPSRGKAKRARGY